MITKITREVLEAYVNCKTKAHLKLAGQQGIRSDYEALLAETRKEVRRQAIDKMLARYAESEVARDISLTAAALGEGPSFVLNATLEDDLLSLSFDGLKRVDGPSKLSDSRSSSRVAFSTNDGPFPRAAAVREMSLATSVSGFRARIFSIACLFATSSAS